MGRTRTPAYAVHFDQVVVQRGGTWQPIGWTAQGWRTEQAGKPTEANLAAFVQHVESSTAPGGVNAHLGITQILAARLVRQRDGKVVATWRPAPFGVLGTAPRKNPALMTMRANPGRRSAARGQVLSTRVVALQYLHEQDGKRAYEHKFKRGVTCELLSDGSVRLYRPDGRKIWGDF